MLTAIGDVMRRVYERGWITTRDGNISMRKREGKYLYITPSGWRKTIVHPEHVVRIEIVKEPLTGIMIPNVREGQQPSGELWMHWNLQRDTRITRTVVHVHATHIVAAIYACFDLQAISAEFPEISRYTRVGQTVPALPALSRELADAPAECFSLGRTERWPSISWGRPTMAFVRSGWIHGPPMNISSVSTTFVRLSSRAM